MAPPLCSCERREEGRGCYRRDEVNSFVLTLKPDKCHSCTTATRRRFLELRNTGIEKTVTVPSLSRKPLGMWISCMPVGVYFWMCMWAFTCIHSYTHPLLLQLSSHSFLRLTSHNPLWFHLSRVSMLRSLLKMRFSQSSPVSHPSSSSALPPTYSFFSNPLPQCYSTIWLRWFCLGAHITLLSSLNWNLKRGAFNMVLPVGMLPSTHAPLLCAVSTAPLIGLPL